MQKLCLTRSLTILMFGTLMAGCAEGGHGIMRDTISADLGSAVQFNKLCQTNRLAPPDGCKRAASTGQGANQAAAGYEEMNKQTSTLRVNGEPVSGIGAAPSQ